MLIMRMNTGTFAPTWSNRADRSTTTRTTRRTSTRCRDDTARLTLFADAAACPPKRNNTGLFLMTSCRHLLMTDDTTDEP